MSNSSFVRKAVKKIFTSEDCDYTNDTLEDWLTTLKCAKNKNLFLIKKLNSYIGIIRSALNYSSNPCYFKIKLDEIKNLVDTLKTGGQC